MLIITAICGFFASRFNYCGSNCVPLPRTTSRPLSTCGWHTPIEYYSLQSVRRCILSVSSYLLRLIRAADACCRSGVNRQSSQELTQHAPHLVNALTPTYYTNYTGYTFFCDRMKCVPLSIGCSKRGELIRAENNLTSEKAFRKLARTHGHRHAAAHKWKLYEHILYLSILRIHFRGCVAVRGCPFPWASWVRPVIISIFRVRHTNNFSSCECSTFTRSVVWKVACFNI